ncbi:putative disease resistance RPP13-like protein 1 [Magnolia sinica]|uniref:putative disease resistance RPP13-like protein 1 n=1 Tax=Magnolia sinica TaxID=86752 RepID=UPI002658222B|nr:putative disease resistance RPP13-like protein 1 [Magnolia sinica]
MRRGNWHMIRQRRIGCISSKTQPTALKTYWTNGLRAEKYHKLGEMGAIPGEFKEVGNEEQKATYLLNETKIFGREEDRDEIIKFLIRASGPDFATIAIVGPEGMGKTTLAGYIYNNVRVKTHFKKRMWVSLSSNIQVNRLAENIIAAADETYNRPSDPLHCLHDAMRGKRFLLILDNVWNEHIVRWDLLKATLEGGASGSRVVVTTRDQNAAVITSTDHPYTLSSLSDEACLSIFSSKAFHGRSETSELSTLKTIGKEIVKKCKGNPLAAEAVGNVMLFKRTEEEWLSVLQGEILDVPDITKADILSYDNYPSHLKPCFAYFSLFPKGHTLSRDVLIKLWMAQNFFIPRSGKEEEEIGRDYFNELLRHSLFREIKKDSDGRVIQCIMHDLPHMLAQFVAKGEFCTTEIERFDSGLFQGRHLSLIVNNNNVASPTPIRFPKPGNVRTLLVFSQAGVEVELQLSHLINPLIHLRALDLSGTSIKWLPNSIENLKLLRYLNLSGSCIEEVPKSVTSLRNLQTLNLNRCQRLHKLSKGISKMVSLRHLEIEETDKLVYLPKGIGQLSSLWTLSKFTVDEMGKGCKMGELSNLNLLRGNLEMRNLGKVERREDAESAELKNKQFLRSLLLDFESNAKEEDGTMLENGEMKKMESVLMGLGPPHANLKELKICNYMGSVLPSWMEDSPFSSLVQLNLHSCRKFKQLPALGKLPSLKILKIQGNEGLEVVGHEFYGGSNTAFPSLKELSFISLTNWEEWNLGVEDGTTKKVMPSLQELYIQDCPKLEGLLGHPPDSL